MVKNDRMNWLNKLERKKLKKKLKHYCYICDKTGELELHHKMPFSQGGLNEIENVIFLCSSCHDRLHKTRRKNINWIKRLEALKQTHQISILKAQDESLAKNSRKYLNT